MNRGFLIRYVWLSVAASIATIVLKTAAWYLTGSVGLFSDAVESLINLAAALIAMAMLKISIIPPDKNHPSGHGKAEYFSSFAEGLLILLAAAGIIYASCIRFFNPQPLEKLGIGLAVSAAASVINFSVARVLLSAGRRYRSITLEADSHHLMTDVWTSAGVIAGVGAVWATGFHKLDPIVAFVVALNIIWTALKILKRSIAGLMDESLSPQECDVIEAVLSSYRSRGIGFHALLTRQGASRRFVSVHVLVPGEMRVNEAHRIAENIENDIRNALIDTVVFTHIEPADDEISLSDIPLDR